MPIEFRCSRCGKLLRTGDDTAGRQAQCPACGTLSMVPTPADTTRTSPLLAPLGTESSASPDTVPGSPFGPGPGMDGATDSDAAKRVSGPATALIVAAILGMILQVLGILGNFVLMAVDFQPPAGAAAQGHDPLAMMVGNGVQVAIGVFSLAMGALVLMGAMKMKNLENYSFAMASAIIAMIPCFSPCCLLGLPLGIWALVVLNDSSVKAAFRS